jgi:hypothetical protein
MNLVKVIVVDVPQPDDFDAGEPGDARRRLDQLFAAQTFAIAGQDVTVGTGIKRVDIGRKTHFLCHGLYLSEKVTRGA